MKNIIWFFKEIVWHIQGKKWFTWFDKNGRLQSKALRFEELRNILNQESR
jgi:hypothetical protein